MSFFKRHPLVLGMISYSGVWVLSSITQQKFISRHEVNYKAVLRNAIVGGFVVAPLLHSWYVVAPKLFGIHTTWLVSLKKTIAEQALVGPVMITSFFVATGVLAGTRFRNIKEEVITKFPKTYMTSCCFFPLVNLVNHMFIPFQFKIIYTSMVSFIWSNFLCFVKEKKVYLVPKQAHEVNVP